MSRIACLPSAQAGGGIRLVYRYARRRFGAVPEPLAVLARLLCARAAVGIAARQLPAVLGNLAVYQVATTVGCSWCVDFGARMHRLAGLDVTQLAASTDYAASPVYSGTQRAVIAYAGSMTETPPAVTDGRVADLRRRLGDPAVLELTYLIAQENLRSRMNHAPGITAQGFAAGEACRTPWEGR